ncbi:NCK-interacting protein with SH3 domain-like [Babylonia areolata]|uniref:NCK-interacting protein with SH3 domain-like n=1 Tax=Babylonia areolata TaxID=304850 RepID=UPI003FD02DDA
MYRALYEYKSSLPDYLSFCAGDQFTVIDRANKDWFRVQNGRGQIGYVPCTYVKQVQVNSEEVLRFVDWSIEAIHLQAASEGAGQYSRQQRETLQKLVKHRADIAEKLQNKPCLDRSQSEDIVRQPKKSPGGEHSRRQSERRRAPSPPSTARGAKQETTQQASAPQPPSSTPATCPPPASPDEGLPIPVNTIPSTPSPSAVTAETDLPPPPEDHHTPPSSPDSDLPPPPSSLPVSHAQENHVTSPPADPTPPDEASSATENDIPAPPSPSDLQALLKALDLPDKMGPELVEEVRKNTGLSFDKSKVAVETVLGYVGFKVPALEALVDRMLSSLHLGRDISDEDISSHDAQRLSVIFSELTACKDDSQQRSWALHEDEAIIHEYLEELLSILENAKPSICRKVVSRDNYDILHNLVQYYQMETRGALCRLLLKVFGALCGLEREVITQLLYSVLPLELAQEMTVNTDDVQRTCYVALVMTMIFSTGDDVSTAVTDKLNEEFFLHILQLIENPPSPQFEDSAVDLLIAFMLAFNLHLTSVEVNVVLRSLATFGTPKVFTERIMVWVNRGEDPAKMFDFKPVQPNSVQKLFLDLYSDLTTSDLLYTNDAKVLMDVIIGRLSNLGPGDKVRSLFLVLCQRVVNNSSYTEHCHRLPDLHRCLVNIRDEEANTADDKRIAHDILTTHPDIFTQ